MDTTRQEFEGATVAPRPIGLMGLGVALTSLGRPLRVVVAEQPPLDIPQQEAKEQAENSIPNKIKSVTIAADLPKRFTSPTESSAAIPPPLRKSSPSTPITSVMQHTHREVPGTIEPLSANSTGRVKENKDWTTEFQSTDGNNKNPATGALFSTACFDRQQAALCSWINSKIDVCTTSEGALASRRLAAKVRGMLWGIYSRDASLKEVMLRLENRIDNKQLCVTADESALKCIDGQSQLLEALNAYHAFWLKLGAEVVVGKSVNKALRIAANADGKKSATTSLASRNHHNGPFKSSSSPELDTFINKFLLNDPALAKRYSGPNKTATFYHELGQLLLKRLLLLVLLLDRAASSGHMPSGAPLLLKKGGKFRSSADILQAAVGPLMKETEVARRVGRLGYKVNYAQHADQEFDFATRKLAVDLRDGVRLCRLAESLCGRRALPEGCRFPAQRRPDRLHNVRLALQTLKEAGLVLEGLQPPNILVSEIVDGDKEGTLCLLWQLVLQCEVPLLASPSLLRLELDILLAGSRQASGVQHNKNASSSVLLLQWADAITSKYGMRVESYDNFADGRAFCMLIHHYLGDAFMPQRFVFSTPPSSPYDYAIFVQHNFAAITQATERLGNIPAIVTANDFLLTEGPDQRAVVLFLALLCRRLVEMSAEQRAAVTIQRAWRRKQAYRPGMALENLRRWISAAQVIQRATRTMLLRNGLKQAKNRRERMLTAVVKLQARWKGRQARAAYVNKKRAAAATKIQAAVRGYQALITYQKQRVEMQQRKEQRAALVIQRHVRGMWARKEAAHRRQAAAIIRREAAAYLLRRREQAVVQMKHQMAELARTMQQYAVRTSAATHIQAAYRGYVARKEYAVLVLEREERIAAQLAKEAAARRVISSYVPVFKARSWFIKARHAARVIQQQWRIYLAQRNSAAVVIQTSVRRFLAERQWKQMRGAVVVLQSHWRGYNVREHHPQKRRLAQLRCNLTVASREAQAAPERTLGGRTRIALNKLLATPAGRMPHGKALEELSHCTSLCRGCCRQVVSTEGAVNVLLGTLACAGRDKTQLVNVRYSLATLAALCEHEEHAAFVYSCMTDGTNMHAVTDLLQKNRENEELFTASVCLLDRLCTNPTRALALSRQSGVLATLEGVARILGHKHSAAGIYLKKLEGTKGSDVSARQATKTFVGVSAQLAMLSRVLAAIGAVDSAETAAAAARPTVKGKNTIVRSVLHELTNVGGAPVGRAH